MFNNESSDGKTADNGAREIDGKTLTPVAYKKFCQRSLRELNGTRIALFGEKINFFYFFLGDKRAASDVGRPDRTDGV